MIKEEKKNQGKNHIGQMMDIKRRRAVIKDMLIQPDLRIKGIFHTFSFTNS